MFKELVHEVAANHVGHEVALKDPEVVPKDLEVAHINHIDPAVALLPQRDHADREVVRADLVADRKDHEVGLEDLAVVQAVEVVVALGAAEAVWALWMLVRIF